MSENKCPHCGSDIISEAWKGKEFDCGSYSIPDFGGEIRRSDLCLERARANKAEAELAKAMERAEKWKACAGSLFNASGSWQSKPLGEAWEHFESLMKEEQK